MKSIKYKLQYCLLCLKAHARVAELVDALVLGTSAARRESSSLSFRTKQKGFHYWKPFFLFKSPK